MIAVDEVHEEPAHAATLLAWVDAFFEFAPDSFYAKPIGARQRIRDALVAQLFDVVTYAPRARA